jgi:hypothetical protein
MLKERVSGFCYLKELFKVLTPVSWEIYHMRNVDQDEWERIKKEVDIKMTRREEDRDEYIKIDRIQRSNASRLKDIVKSKGCITISKYGIIASHCAWLIVQHSDHDIDFQKRYLELMKQNTDDVHEDNVKYLGMRVGCR